MTETGMIREIKGRHIIITPDRACFGCMNMECKTGRSVSAENPEALPLEKGQLVEMKAQSAVLWEQALAVLLPPILGFIAGFALMRLFFSGAGEGAAFGVGFIAFFTVAFIIYRIREKKPARRSFTVTKIIGMTL